MLRELLEACLTPAPAWARRLQLPREQAAIRARHRRHAAAWAPHLAASRAAMGAALAAVRPRAVVVLGGGVLLDVPLAELTAGGTRVLIVDGCAGRAERRAIAAAGAEFLSWDVSAGGAPPWGAADLTISANLASQLGLAPARRAGLSGAAADAERDRHAAAHVAWLRAQPGARLLIADTHQLAIDTDGSEADRVTLGGLPATAPDRTWAWDIAPRGEWDRRYALRHLVAAWCWADRR
jgi:hypothetical protein